MMSQLMRTSLLLIRSCPKKVTLLIITLMILFILLLEWRMSSFSTRIADLENHKVNRFNHDSLSSSISNVQKQNLELAERISALEKLEFETATLAKYNELYLELLDQTSTETSTTKQALAITQSQRPVVSIEKGHSPTIVSSATHQSLQHTTKINFWETTEQPLSEKTVSLNRLPTVADNIADELIAIYLNHTNNLNFVKQNFSENKGTRFQCLAPELNAFDSEMMAEYMKHPRLECDNSLNQGLIYVDENLELNYNATLMAAFDWSCYYRCFTLDAHYHEIIYGNWSNMFVYSKPTPKPLPLPCEAIELSCSADQESFSDVVYKIKPIARKLENNRNKPRIEPESQPNVILLYLDSVSQSNFKRAMPKLKSYLTQGLMKSVYFDSMISVGENSFPNIVPALTGLSVFDQSPDSDNLYEDYPLLWKNFSALGYATLYGSDLDTFGVFDSYGAEGFKTKPVDHYMRAFSLRMEEEDRGSMCFRHRAKHNILLDAIKDLWQSYPITPKFAFIWVTIMAHDDMTGISAADDDFVDFFMGMESKLKENTFTFVLGDHGFRMGEIQKTRVGQLESKLPAFTVSVPNWFTKQYPVFEKAVRKNAKTRTVITAFDLHRTLEFIMKRKWTQFSTAAVKAFYERENTRLLSVKDYLNTIRTNYSAPGRPIFYPIAIGRTCIETGLFDQYCICEAPIRLYEKSFLAETGAKFVLDNINKILNNNVPGMCHNLSLQEVNLAVIQPASFRQLTARLNPTSAESVPSNETLFRSDQTNFAKNKTLLHLALCNMTLTMDLTITTSPNLAIFQTRVVYVHTVETGTSWTMEGSAERMSKYGNESYCIDGDDRVTRMSCYCLGFEPKFNAPSY